MNMNVSRIRSAALAALTLLTIAGCKQSRINDAEAIDVCQLVSSTEAERILGPAAVSAPAEREPGFAGSCTWSIQASDAPVRLSAQVMTRASASSLLTTPKNWFENPVRLGEAKASLGEPDKINGLGFVAWRYGTRLFARKGEVVVVVYSDRGGVVQMEPLAQTLFSPRND
jgi:hypothetical protein